jgi:hypothetical protein
MATRNIVPRADKEGQIGTTIKKWLKGAFVNLFVTDGITDGDNVSSVAKICETEKETKTLDLTSDEIDLSNLDGADNTEIILNRLNDAKIESELFESEYDLDNLKGV